VSTLAVEAIQRDQLAMAVAGALAIANQTAVREGINVPDALVTITEETDAAGRCWRIHYGPRDYVRRRGGDLFVLVEDATGKVKQVLRGQ
jgi:hypothetical protein